MLKLLPALAVVLMPAMAVAQDDFNVLSGTIAGFECGDNCYLTVDLGDAGTLSALCVAAECEPWNAEVAIPGDLIGAPVKVAVGVGEQLTGDGTFAPYLAFTSVSLGS